MDFVWIVLVLLILLSSGQGDTERIKRSSDSCPNCSAGYFKNGSCINSTVKEYCKRCDENTFIDKENLASRCLMCTRCGSLEVEVQDCDPTHDRKCDCKEGYHFHGICHPCSSFKNYGSKEYLRKCCTSKACLEDPECQKICNTRGNGNGEQTTPRADLIPDNSGYMVAWVILVVAVVGTFLVCCWLLMLINRNICSDCNTRKDLETPAEDPKSNEQCSHQDSSLATLQFNISEETPIMSPCQKPPAHNSNHQPDIRHVEEQSDRWPAIVLYAIIKEVPLRRWKEFLRLLSVADQQMERVELGAGLDSMEKQYQMLRLWSQRSSASLNDIYSSLRYMDLSGCAQLLQESLEKLQWKSEAE